MIRRFLLLLAMLCVTACQSLGVPPVDTFNKRLAAGYIAVQTIAETTTTLLQAGKITVADAQRVRSTNTTALQGLDAANLLAHTDAAGAATRLDATIAVLSGLQAFLATKGSP